MFAWQLASNPRSSAVASTGVSAFSEPSHVDHRHFPIPVCTCKSPLTVSLTSPERLKSLKLCRSFNVFSERIQARDIRSHRAPASADLSGLVKPQVQADAQLSSRRALGETEFLPSA
jgi:hypothetical protein